MIEKTAIIPIVHRKGAKPQIVIDKVKRRIYRRGRSSVFTAGDFADISNLASIDLALYRLAKRGTIRRITRGLYLYPEFEPNLAVAAPSVEAIASALAAAKAAFRDFYQREGVKRVSGRVEYFAPKAGVAAGTVAVRDLGNRWASCSPSGALAFHWKCVMAPLSVIDYIVVHELCHLRHRDHTNAFWNEVDKILPDYRERKEWLRKNGAGLDV